RPARPSRRPADLRVPGRRSGGAEEGRPAPDRGLGGAAVPRHRAGAEHGAAHAVGSVRSAARSPDLLRRDPAGLGALLDGGGRLLVRAAPTLVGAAARLPAAQAAAERLRAPAYLLQRAAR